jgi:hypothetical protein
MKLATKNQKKVKREKQSGIMDMLDGGFLPLFQTSDWTKISLPFKRHLEAFNIFLNQNKGKGPPGRTDGPEAGQDPEPDIQSAARKGDKINYQKIYQINEYQFLNFYYKTIFKF